MKKTRILLAAMLFSLLSPGGAGAQDFGEAQSWAVEEFAKRQAEYTEESSKNSATNKDKGRDSEVKAALNVGALPLGINKEQKPVKYKLKSYSGEGPLQGVQLPHRLFRVPYNGRD